MSEYDDFDDFGNESFENDKKAKPVPVKVPVNAKAKHEPAKKSVSEIDRSYVEEPHSGNHGARRLSRDSNASTKNKKEPIRRFSKENEHSRQQSEKAHVAPSSNSIQNSSANVPGTKQQLIDKNLKLKQELKVLASELDTILQREKQKREQRYSQSNEDSELKDRKNRVQKQVVEINKLKQNITRVKNQLENVYGNNNVVQREDELQFLKKQIFEVKTEYDGLVNVNEKQMSALQEIKSAGHSSANMSRLRENLLKAKEEYKKLNEQVSEQEREMRKQHEALVNKEDAIRQLNERIQEKKRQQNSNSNSNSSNPHQLNEDEVADRDIMELEEKIKEQEQRRKNIEKQYQERQKQLEKEKKDMLNDQARKAMILKGKEKEFKLNQIKLREVEKYIKNIRSKDDTKSVASESHVETMERENSKNAKNVKRTIVGQKKSVGGDKGAARVEEEREVESDDDITKKSSAAAIDKDHRGRPRNNPVITAKKEASSKGQSKTRLAEEEEVDLDEMNYGNEFEDYESRHSSKQGKRVSKSQSKHESDTQNREQPKPEQRQQQFKSDKDEHSVKEEINKPSDSKEDEEANVFAKPSFMLKKKK